MGALIQFRVHARTDHALVKEAQDLEKDTLAAIRLVASISARLKSIERGIEDIEGAEEREAVHAAAKTLRDTVRSAFNSVGSQV